MEAVLLTHDVQLGLAELVHKTYARTWKAHPFMFRVPFNATGSGAFSYLMAQPNCRMIRAPSGIRASMAALLEGIDPSDWVFWCIDDRFPIALDWERATAIVDDLGAVPDQVEEIKLLHWKEPLLRDRMAIGTTRFRSQAPGSRARGFWHHHFTRAGLLRAVFLGAGIGPESRIYAVTELIKAKETVLFRGTAQVPRKPLLRLGEPLVEGLLTRNGRRWLEHMNCDIPPYGSTERDVEFS